MKKMMFNDRYGLTEAVIEKRKTVTRRVVNIPKWACDIAIGHDGTPIVSDGNECFDRMRCEYIKPPYKVGEIVAVAQSYKDCGEFDVYEAPKDTAGWNNKMFVRADLMPHQIRILDVRAERLQDITEEDCLQDVPEVQDMINSHYKQVERYGGRVDNNRITRRQVFARIIDKISGRGTWERNPYVWRIEFELIK